MFKLSLLSIFLLSGVAQASFIECRGVQRNNPELETIVSLGSTSDRRIYKLTIAYNCQTDQCDTVSGLTSGKAFDHQSDYSILDWSLRFSNEKIPTLYLNNEQWSDEYFSCELIDRS